MLAFLQTFISFAALATLCVFCARQLRVGGGLTPLAVTAATLLYFSVCGMLNVLMPGGILYFALALAALVYLLATRKKGGFENVFTPGFALFCVGTLLLMALFAVRQPYLLGWDEFSLWGPAARLTTDTNSLYTVAQFGWPWVSSQKPGLPCLAYFFNFFGEFAPWRMYIAYDVLYLGVAAAMVAVLPWKKWYLAVPAGAAALVLPYFLRFQRELAFCNEYLDSYADIPMGILMGGTLVYYYQSRKAQGGRGAAGVLCILGAVAMCKDTGMPLALVAATVILADVLFCEKEFRFARLQKAPAKAAFGAAMYAVPLACYVGWSRYLVSLGSEQGSVGGESNFSPVQMLVQGTRMLLGLPVTGSAAAFTEKFAAVKANMLSTFANAGNTFFGSGLRTVLGLTAICVLVCLLAQDKTHRRRTVLFTVLMPLGFLAYFVFIGFTYVFVFKGELGTGITDYTRYIGTFYLAWAAGTLALAVQGAVCESRFAGKSLPTLATLVCFAFLLRCGQFVPATLSFVDYPEIVYTDSRLFEQQADALRASMGGDGGRIFYVNSQDDGGSWFVYSYALLPYVLDYSWGGGYMADPAAVMMNEEVAALPEGENTPGIPALRTDYYFNHISAEQFAATLASGNVAYILLLHAEDTFFASYGAFFADDAAAYYNNETILYKVNIKEGYTLETVTPQNGELCRESGSLAVGDTITIMPNAAEYVTFTPVETEVLV